MPVADAAASPGRLRIQRPSRTRAGSRRTLTGFSRKISIQIVGQPAMLTGNDGQDQSPWHADRSPPARREWKDSAHGRKSVFRASGDSDVHATALLATGYLPCQQHNIVSRPVNRCRTKTSHRRFDQAAAPGWQMRAFRAPGLPASQVCRRCPRPADGHSGSSAVSPATLASPQSSSNTSPKGPGIILAGLMSRWITPCSCA